MLQRLLIVVPSTAAATPFIREELLLAPHQPLACAEPYLVFPLVLALVFHSVFSLCSLATGLNLQLSLRTPAAYGNNPTDVFTNYHSNMYMYIFVCFYALDISPSSFCFVLFTASLFVIFPQCNLVSPRPSLMNTQHNETWQADLVKWLRYFFPSMN